MNNWICPKCNTANTDRFCLNCGEDSNLGMQSASDLPPTVFGVPPISPANQPNQFQNPPNPIPPNFGQMPNQPSISASKSLIFGGVSLLAGATLGFIGQMIRLLKVYNVIKYDSLPRILDNLAVIAGLVLGLIFGIIGLNVGLKALGKINRGLAPPEHKQRITIGIALSAFSIVLVLVFFISVIFRMDSNFR